MSWTAADQAELDVLVHELVVRYFEHRETCIACQTPFEVCPRVRKAIGVVLDWREARILLSRAEALRAERFEFERERAA